MMAQYDPGEGVPDGVAKSERYLGHWLILREEPAVNGSMFGLPSDVNWIHPVNFKVRIDGSRMTVEVVGILMLMLLLVWLTKPRKGVASDAV